jgi:hypothetical protein
VIDLGPRVRRDANCGRGSRRDRALASPFGPSFGGRALADEHGRWPLLAEAFRPDPERPPVAGSTRNSTATAPQARSRSRSRSSSVSAVGRGERTHGVMRSLDVGVLALHYGAELRGDLLPQRFVVCLDGVVFALLGRIEDGLGA